MERKFLRHENRWKRQQKRPSRTLEETSPWRPQMEVGPFCWTTYWYGLIIFSIAISALHNAIELTEEMENVLPSTDSRLRTDLRALTHGNVKQAGREKILIEERERRKRREREAQGKKWAPQYFKVQPLTLFVFF